MTGSTPTVARRDLDRNPRFAELSPEVGTLDADAVERAIADDPDETMALLVDMAAATDPALRMLAMRLSGRLLVELARADEAARRGVGRPRAATGATDGDLDVDASLDAIVAARSAGRAVSTDELVSRRWERHDTAVCLLVDRSGSMAGRRLATAALAAAVVAVRYGAAGSVMAFADDVTTIERLGELRPAEVIVEELLALRGRGTTDLAGAIDAAVVELSRTDAARRVLVVLSDCRANAGADAIGSAAAALATAELVVIAPRDDQADARSFAGAVAAPLITIAGPASVPDALANALAAR